MKYKPISKQTIVITGASSGIGLATAEMAAKEGANVVIASRNASDLQRIAKRLNAEGSRVIAVEADVKNYEDVEKIRDEAIGAFGQIDTWVNNAGTSIYGNLLDEPLEAEKELFEVNFWGVRHGCRVAADALKKEGGVIINLGSEVSGRSVPIQGMYAATKHAIKAYTDALRMELEKDGYPIFVSLIRPTAINTPFAEHATSYLKEGEPSLPTPTYHPDVVAKAILTCAESPQRDVFVGGGSRFFDLMDTFFPRALDFVMEKFLFEEQTKGTAEPHKKSKEILFDAAKEGKKMGASEGRMHKRSLYTEASQSRPLKRLLITGVIATIVGAAAVKAAASAR